MVNLNVDSREYYTIILRGLGEKNEFLARS